MADKKLADVYLLGIGKMPPGYPALICEHCKEHKSELSKNETPSGVLWLCARCDYLHFRKREESKIENITQTWNRSDGVGKQGDSGTERPTSEMQVSHESDEALGQD